MNSGSGGAGVLFRRVPGGVEATEWARGPWANQILHGGAISGLLGWATEAEQRRLGERLGVEQVCSRLTVEILSGMPMAAYAVSTRAAKPGKRTALVDAEIRTLDDSARLVARATSQWLTPIHDDPNEEMPVSSLPPIPAERADPGANPDIDYPRPGFNADAVDFRWVIGSTETAGPGQTWARLDVPLMAGEPTSPFVQLATLADLGAAIGWDYSPTGGAYINTDVTLQMVRPPMGEWFLFDSATTVAPRGLAGTHTDVFDSQGRVGWVLQSQIEAPPEIGLPGGMAASRLNASTAAI